MRRRLVAAALCAAGVVGPATLAGATPAPVTTLAGADDSGSGTSRSWSVSGTPTHSSTAKGDAPRLAPGQYTETFQPDRTVRYYRLERQSGATIHVSVAGRPPAASDTNNREGLELDLMLPDGTSCVSNDADRSDTDGGDSLLLNALVLDGDAVERSDLASKECLTATSFVLGVKRDPTTGSKPMPAEILYLQEPKATGKASLPAPASGQDVSAITAPSSGETTKVSGSGSLSGAPTLTEGSYVDTISVGQQVFYRVRVGYGQRAAFTVEAPRNGSGYQPGGTVNLEAGAYGPDRMGLSTSASDPGTSASLYQNEDEPETFGTFTTRVNYRNREADSITSSGDVSTDTLQNTSLGGYYYFSVRASTSDTDGVAKPVPMRISVKVTGTARKGPSYAGSPATAPGQDTTDSDGSGVGRTVLWAGGGIVLVAVLVGGGALAVRRRRATGA